MQAIVSHGKSRSDVLNHSGGYETESRNKNVILSKLDLEDSEVLKRVTIKDLVAIAAEMSVDVSTEEFKNKKAP